MLGDLEPFLTPQVRSAILQHMKAEAPRECCGLITLSKGQYTYEPKQNVSADPENYFEFDKETKVAIMRRKSIVAYVHSHPLGPISPSARDVEVQIAVNKPSVIAYVDEMGQVGVYSFGDHLLDAPLNGRPFFYNRFDCVQGLRSIVKQREGRIIPPPPPSDEGWWYIGADNPSELQNNPNLYLNNFREYGYEEFSPDFGSPRAKWHPKPGDVLLMQLGAPVINHAAYYIGNNLIWHHRDRKHSGEQAVGYLLPSTRKWVRHESNIQ